MAFPPEIWLKILNDCGPVGLHVLYCCNRQLNALVENIIRKKSEAAALSLKITDSWNRYLLKTVAVPVLIVHDRYVDLGWLDDFYANLNFRLIEWYGIKTITRIFKYNNSILTFGLDHLLSWRNNRTNEEIESLIRFLIEHNIFPISDQLPYIPRRRDRHYKSDVSPDISENGLQKHLLSTIVHSGRLVLLSNFADFLGDPMIVSTLLSEDYDIDGQNNLSGEQILLAHSILSSNVEMTKTVQKWNTYNEAAKLWLNMHFHIALATSDEMSDYVLSQMFSSKKRFPSSLLGNMFIYADKEEQLDRTLRYLRIIPSVDEVLSMFGERWRKYSHINADIKVVISWLQKKQWLSREKFLEHLEELFGMTMDPKDIIDEELIIPSDYCDLASILERDFGYMGLLPEKAAKTYEIEITRKSRRCMIRDIYLETNYED